METEKNISGISENLSESIAEQKLNEKSEFSKSLFYGKRFAISVSLSDDIENLGLSEEHLDDISIEIARYLIVNGATLLYGGDLKKGFTELFSALAYQYKYLNDKEPRFENYIHFLNVKKITNDEKVNLLRNQVKVKYLDCPPQLTNFKINEVVDPKNIVLDRYINAESLSAMRIKMVEESDARIILGGRQKEFTGYFPGIIEETYLSVTANKPIYLVGGFGGATKSIIETILGNFPYQLTNEFQFDTTFLKEFLDYCKDKSTVKLDYDFIVDFFKGYSIESLSKKNGLSVEENHMLFESTNVHEIVFLIIKGLQNISK